MKNNKFKRLGGARITLDEVEEMILDYPPQWGTPKYLLFIHRALSRNFGVKLYEAQRTVSKYVTVYCGKKRFKVRFSNHKPIEERELRGDCDFFVGVTNFHTATADDAWDAMMERFGRSS